MRVSAAFSTDVVAFRDFLRWSAAALRCFLDSSLRLRERRGLHRVPRKGRLARTLPGVTQAPFPGFIEPMHPTQPAKVPAGARGQYEIKLDGWRGRLHLRSGAAKMFSRNGNDLTAQCATIVAAAGDMQATTAVLDGESLCRTAAASRLPALRSAMSRGRDRLAVLRLRSAIPRQLRLASRALGLAAGHPEGTARKRAGQPHPHERDNQSR
jgi:ATP-dependent DNA ligase